MSINLIFSASVSRIVLLMSVVLAWASKTNNIVEKGLVKSLSN